MTIQFLRNNEILRTFPFNLSFKPALSSFHSWLKKIFDKEDDDNNDGQARQMRKRSAIKVFSAFCLLSSSKIICTRADLFISPTYFSIIRAQRFSTFDNLIISVHWERLRFDFCSIAFLSLFPFPFFFSRKNQRSAKHSFEQSATGHSSMTKNEFLFFTTGKQTRSIIARVESLTFRLPPLIITLRRGVSYRLNVDPTWSTPRVNRYARVNFTNIINDYPYRHESPLRDNTTAIVIALSSIPRKSSCACINEVNPFHYSYRTPPYHCSRPSKGAGWESKAYCDSSSPND